MRLPTFYTMIFMADFNPYLPPTVHITNRLHEQYHLPTKNGYKMVLQAKFTPTYRWCREERKFEAVLANPAPARRRRQRQVRRDEEYGEATTEESERLRLRGLPSRRQLREKEGSRGRRRDSGRRYATGRNGRSEWGEHAVRRPIASLIKD